MLSPSIVDAEVAEQLFQVAASYIPMAAASGTAFQLVADPPVPPVPLAACGSGSPTPRCGSSSAARPGPRSIGVQRLAGFWYPKAGPWAWLALLHTLLLSAGGFLALDLRRASPAARPTSAASSGSCSRANFVTYAGLVDVGLAYGIGVFPLGWLLSGIGSLLVVRALVVEDLLRVRAVDTTRPAARAPPRGVDRARLGRARAARAEHRRGGSPRSRCACASPGSAPRSPTVGLVNRGGRGRRGSARAPARPARRPRPHADRRARDRPARDRRRSSSASASARPCCSRPRRTGAGPPSAARASPTSSRPIRCSMSWLAERRGALFADDLEAVPAGSPRAGRDRCSSATTPARSSPIGSADELIGLIVIPARAARRLRGRPLEFLERAAERTRRGPAPRADGPARGRAREPRPRGRARRDRPGRAAARQGPARPRRAHRGRLVAARDPVRRRLLGRSTRSAMAAC